MFMRVLLVLWCVSGGAAQADEMPMLPLTAERLPVIIRERVGVIKIHAELYMDTVGGSNIFFKLYYSEYRRSPFRISVYAPHENEITIWTAPGFENFEDQP